MKRSRLVDSFCWSLCALLFFQLGSFKSLAQCVVTANTDTLSACIGDTVYASASGMANYDWSGSSSLSCTQCPAPYVIVGNTIDTLIVKGTASTSMNAVNGNFSSGNTGFSSNYTYNPTSIWNEGTYAVGPNPNTVHPNFGTWGDHTTGSGNYMLINGSTTSNRMLWQQNISFPPNTTITMEWWMLTFVTPSGSVILKVNGQNIGSSVSTPSTTGVWRRSQFTFTSPNSTGTSNVQIITVSSLVAGNDFGIDDISFSYACESYDTIYVVPNSTAYIQTQLNTPKVGCDELCASWTNQSSLDSTQAYYWWDYGDGSPLDSTFNGQHCYQGAGQYFVKLFAESFSGCPDSTWLDTITVGDSPIISNLDLSGDGGTIINGNYVQPSQNGEVQLDVTLAGLTEVDTLTIDWGDYSESIYPVGNISSYSRTHYYTNFNPVNICVHVSTALGCFDDMCIGLTFTPSVILPCCFTPNGDGVNDRFFPLVEGTDRVKWTVYNRWGKFIYSTSSLEGYWDGKYNGQMCAEGTYFIVFEAWGYYSTEPYRKSGSIELLY